MLFNSYAFLFVFLPVAIAAYAVAYPHPKLRMPVLIVLSLAFYSYWDIRFLPIMIGSVLGNWLLIRVFVATRRPGILTAAIVLDLFNREGLDVVHKLIFPVDAVRKVGAGAATKSI